MLGIISFLFVGFVSATTCESEIEDRLENIEAKIDTIESHYNLLPTIAQDVKNLEIDLEDIQVEDSNFKIYLIPGTIIISLLIILTIILVRNKNGWFRHTFRGER